METLLLLLCPARLPLPLAALVSAIETSAWFGPMLLVKLARKSLGNTSWKKAQEVVVTSLHGTCG